METSKEKNLKCRKSGSYLKRRRPFVIRSGICYAQRALWSLTRKEPISKPGIGKASFGRQGLEVVCE